MDRPPAALRHLLLLRQLGSKVRIRIGTLRLTAWTTCRNLASLGSEIYILYTDEIRVLGMVTSIRDESLQSAHPIDKLVIRIRLAQVVVVGLSHRRIQVSQDLCKFRSHLLL